MNNQVKIIQFFQNRNVCTRGLVHLRPSPKEQDLKLCASWWSTAHRGLCEHVSEKCVLHLACNQTRHKQNDDS